MATSDAQPLSMPPTAEQRAEQELSQGAVFLEQGEYDVALACYERSVDIHDSARAQYNLGICLYALQRHDDAIAAWEKSIELSPSSDAHNNLATAVMLRKPPVPERALSHFREAIKLSPSDGQIRFNLAAVLEATGRLQDSLEEYKLAKELGIERADQNIRNVGAKLVRERVDAEAGQASEAAKS